MRGAFLLHYLRVAEFDRGLRDGISAEEIEAAYMDKNAVNHQRQQEGK
ncbi:dUTP diphosphatase [Bacillus velezensis]